MRVSWKPRRFDLSHSSLRPLDAQCLLSKRSARKDSTGRTVQISEVSPIFSVFGR